MNALWFLRKSLITPLSFGKPDRLLNRWVTDALVSPATGFPLEEITVTNGKVVTKNPSLYDKSLSFPIFPDALISSIANRL